MITNISCKKKAAEPETLEVMSSTAIMEAGDKVFELTLIDNAAAQAFLSSFPLTLEMKELNGNEKYAYLDTTFPTDSYYPKTIETGDVMLYGNNCIVVFYKTFSTSYSYTKIGKLSPTDSLQEALGTGNITIKFKQQ